MKAEQRAEQLIEAYGLNELPRRLTARFRYALPEAIREAENEALERAANSAEVFAIKNAASSPQTDYVMGRYHAGEAIAGHIRALKHEEP